MKKKCIGVMFVCALLIAMCMTGCDAKSDDSIIKITKSDEAEQFEEEHIVAGKDKEYFKKGNIEKTLDKLKDRGEQSFPECDVENKLELEKYEGSKVYTLTKDDYENIILYIHGGAWVFEISAEHVTFCDELATRLNAKVYMPLYPLAPQAKSDETYAMIEGLYKELLKEGKTVYVMGDSAGGNLSLGLMYTIKKEELDKPDKMVLLSPCTDMTFSNSDIEEAEKTDPELVRYGTLLCAKLWAGEDSLKDPKNSAIYADVSGYPDTMIIQGTNEIIYPDNVKFYQKMKDAGVNVTFAEGEDLWHVFPIYPIPEKEESLKLIEEFCSK